MSRRIVITSVLVIGGLYFLGCASHKPCQNVAVMVAPVTGRTLSSNEVAALRSGEIVKKYYVGAYVDPLHPQVRHDPHMVERIEQKSRWNLHPNVAVAACGPTYQAVEDNALKNAMQQQHDREMQKQREANAEAQSQSVGLREEISELKKGMLSQGEDGLKRVEEKMEGLRAKVISIERSCSAKASQDGLESSSGAAQSSSSSVEHKSQSTKPTGQALNPWEKPVQGE